MADLVEVGLFRHGSTDWNLEGRLQGLTDTELSQLGRAQVSKAAERLSDQGWERILSSPLTRALHSADILAATLGLPKPDIIEEVTERAFGIGEGMRYAEWFELQAAGQPIAGAESDTEVDGRVDTFLRRMQVYQESKVLVVSHGGFIRRVVRIVSQSALPPTESRLQNASLQRIAHTGGLWGVTDWNPVSLADG